MGGVSIKKKVQGIKKGEKETFRKTNRVKGEKG